MNKIIKYGLVAGLTMATFSLATVPATGAYASSAYTCGSTTAVAGGETVTIARDATTCVIKGTFTNALSATPPFTNALTVSATGLTWSPATDATDYTWVVDGNDAIVTLTTNGIAKLISDGAATITMSDTTESFTVTVEAEPFARSFTYSLNGATAASLDITGGEVELTDATTSLSFAANFEHAITITPPFTNALTVTATGLTWSPAADVTDYTWTADGNDTTVTLTASGIAKVLASDTDVVLTIKDTNDTYSVTLKAKTVVELESVAATIENDKIETEYNEGYEGTPVVTYTVPEEFDGVVTVAADGTITVADDYKTATDKTVTITVTATDGEIVKTTTVDYTIEANYTAVEASFEDDKDTIMPSETTKLVMPEVEGVVYTWDYNGPITIAEDGTISVVEGYMSSFDEEATITVNGFAGEGEDAVLLTAKTLTLTVKANWSYDEESTYEVTEGNKQTVIAGTKKALTFKIDAPFSQFMGAELYNKTLYDYLDSIDMSEMTDEEIDALLTEEQWESIFMWLTEGEDYTVEEGSTIITLSDAVVAKLVAGEYRLLAYYRDDTDIDNIVDSYTEATFTVTTTAPDTGAATAVKAGATSSVLASVLAAITAAGAAVVAKFAKRK